MLKTSITNLILRGLTLVSKFILLLFIARCLSPENLGIYGLVSVSITISLYFLGMDFYAFNSREIIAQSEDGCAPLIRDQLVFHGLVYLIILPLLIILFVFDFIAWQYIGWFYALLILEHLSQESNRLLITLSRPTMANIVLFLRSGIWVYAVVGTGYFYRDTRTLQFIWLMWCLGGILCVLMTIFTLRNLNWKKTFNLSVDWQWLKRGFLKSMPFFGSTVAILGVQYADRFFIQNYHGEAMVGVYTFYANISNVLQTFIFTGVIAILYPKIIDAFQKRKYDEYKALMRKMSVGIIGGVVIFSGIAIVSIVPLLKLVNKTIYNDYLTVFWILLAKISILVICSIPHYGLFVRHKDRQIFISTLVAVIFTITLDFILVPKYGVQGAAISCLVGYIVLFLLKTNFLVRGKSLPVEFQEDEKVGIKP